MITVANDGPARHLVFDRPARMNAIDAAGWEDLGAELRRIEGDPSVRVVVLRGAGDHFCAGADLSASGPSLPTVLRMREINDTVRALHRCTRPVVSAVRGNAVGAGWNLALAGDFVVADRSARFSQIFVRRGLSIDAGGSWLLPRLVPAQVARRLAYLGEIIDAAEAERLGLLHRLVDVGELDAATDDLVARLAEAPPLALAQTKDLLARGGDRRLDDALDAEAAAQAVNSGGGESAEGRRAFAERRPPDFPPLDAWRTR